MLLHLEVLVEDKSGSIVIEHFLNKIIMKQEPVFTYNIHPYKGLGALPKNLNSSSEPNKRILLDRLPSLLRGYGKCLDDYGAVIVVVDNDSRNCILFKQELISLLDQCYPAPRTAFCIAIEEIEAWLLGDIKAIKKAYPLARRAILDAYVQDSICGTWEVLADAICSEKSSGLKKAGFAEIGRRKSEWAQKITPLVDIDQNKSNSLKYFIGKVEELTNLA